MRRDTHDSQGEGHCHHIFHREILTQGRLDVELNYPGFRGGEFLNVELSQRDSRTKKLIRIPARPHQPRHFQPVPLQLRSDSAVTETQTVHLRRGFQSTAASLEF